MSQPEPPGGGGWTTNIVIAVATAINALASILLWYSTNRYVGMSAKTFAASQFPLVTVARIETSVAADGSGFVFMPILKNFGGGIAYKSRDEIRVTLGGSPMEVSKVPDEPVIMPAGAEQPFTEGTIAGIQHRQIMAGAATLRIEIDSRYENANGEAYHSHAASQFRPGPPMGWLALEQWCKDSKDRPCAPRE
jgi:hypothetical protein